GHAEELRKRAGVREAGLRVLSGTEVRAPLATARTVSAGAKPLGDDHGTGADRVDPGPDRFDSAGPFVARADRVADVRRGPAAVEHVDVGAADADRADANEHLAGSRLRNGHA